MEHNHNKIAWRAINGGWIRVPGAETCALANGVRIVGPRWGFDISDDGEDITIIKWPKKMKDMTDLRRRAHAALMRVLDAHCPRCNR